MEDPRIHGTIELVADGARLGAQSALETPKSAADVRQAEVVERYQQ